MSRTATAKQPTIRPIATAFVLNVPDESGRMVGYRIQVAANGVSCWNDKGHGGHLTPAQLFSCCCQKAAVAEEGR